MPSAMTEKIGRETYRAGSTKQGAKVAPGTKLDRAMTRNTVWSGRGALDDPTTWPAEAAVEGRCRDLKPSEKNAVLRL